MAKNVDTSLETRGFKLVQTIDCPIPDVDDDAKMYVYFREECHEAVTFDTSQNSIQITSSWYSIDDLRAIVDRAEKLGIK